MLNDDLIKKLGRKYEPAAMLHIKFRGVDVAFKTDAGGNPVLCFVGKLTAEGNIKGERYSRVLKTDKNGVIIKDHWELKGKAT